jgi:hypothetical protein
MDGTAMEAATVEPSTAAAAATPASECVIWNQACGNQNDCCETSENIPKHDASSLLMWGLRLARFAWHVDFGCAPGKTARLDSVLRFRCGGLI